jgi:hypothetical protein
MNKEELKKLCKEEFLKNIKEYIKSETIFTYVDGLEKENNKQKEVLDKIKKYIEENKLPEIYYDIESLKPILKHYIDADKILELLEEII